MIALLVAAAMPILVDDASVEIPVWRGVEVLEDPSGGLSVDDVATPANAARFTSWPGSGPPNFGFTSSAVWMRFSPENSTDHAIERWLEMEDANVDDVRLYESAGPGASRVRAQGRAHPLAEQEMRRRTSAFRITLAPHETRAFHVRVESQNEVVAPLVLWETGALLTHDVRTTLVYAFLYGVLLTMALYNLFVFLFLKDRAHLIYAAYAAGACAWSAAIDGHLQMLLPRSIGVFPRWPYLLAGTLCFSAALLFARRLLQLREQRPRLDRVMLGLVVSYLVWLPFGLWAVEWRTQNRISMLTVMLSISTSFVIGVIRWRDGLPAARYFVAAWSVLTAAVLVMALNTQGALNFPAFGYSHLGFAGEALLFSLALADSARRRNEHIARLHAAGRRFVPFEFLALLGRRELPEVREGDRVEREMTVFFADMRDFTKLSESLTPEQTMRVVNDFVGALEPSIRAHRGFVDKYIGDAVMALFERPADAVQAALGSVAAIGRLNVEREKRGETPLRIGIGLHAGPLVLGTVGAGERLSCTVIGDTVNLASRIEGLTKQYGTSVLVTAEVTKGLDSKAFAVESVDRVTVKGKSIPVEVFSVRDAAGPVRAAS